MVRRRACIAPSPVLLLVGAATAIHAQVPTPITLPVLKAEGYVDNSYVACGASTARIRKVGTVLQLDLSCGAASTITCNPKPAGLSITHQRLSFDCLSAMGQGAFRAALLPQAAMVQPGGMASLQVQVYNNTAGALSSLVVSAPGFAAQCAATRSSLAAGNVWQYACAISGISADTTVPLQISARTAGNQILTTRASANVMLLGPRIDIAVTPPAQTLLTPGTAYWGVTVSNFGTTGLTNVMAADDDSGSNCVLDARPLAPYTAVYYTCKHPNVMASLAIVHTAQGWDGVRTHTAAQQVLVRFGNRIFHDGFEQQVLFADGFERR